MQWNLSPMNRKGRIIGGTMIILGGALLLSTAGDWIANYSGVYELFDRAAEYITPSPIIYGIIAIISGVFTIRNRAIASGTAYMMGALDLILTTALFVGQEYHGIDISLTQVTNILLWVGVIFMITGGTVAMISDSENRVVFGYVTIIFVIPLVVSSLIVIFLFFVVF